jgi:tetratricopeptide (TPR) repeat protein
MSRCLRDFSTGALLTPPIVKHGPAFAAFSSDGKYVAAANNVEFGCYSFATHKLIGGSLGSRSFLYFLPGTDLLLSNTEGKLRVWDPDTAEEILPSMGDTGATRLICGPQGTELVLSKPVGFTEIELPFIEGSAANLGHEAALVSKTTLQSLDAAKWARLKKRPISPSPELSPFLERIDEKPLSNDFTLSSAIRDANMHWPDKGNRMALAEAAAKVEDWAEAERTLDALASEGVDGLGFDFLAASVALAQKKYVRAEEGYRKALTFDKATDVSEKRKIYQLLCQSLIGTGEFKEASDEFKSEPTANDYQASIALALSISAKAAGGQIDEAVGELRRRSEEREKLGAMFDDTAEYFAPIAASLGVSPELLETYVRSLDGEDLSAVAVSTQAIYFAEIGQFRKARQLLQSAIAPADEPLYLLAQALSSEPSQRNQLMKSCLEACHRLIQENNCTTPETTQKLIRAKIISLVENSHRGFTVLKAATK